MHLVGNEDENCCWCVELAVVGCHFDRWIENKRQKC